MQEEIIFLTQYEQNRLFDFAKRVINNKRMSGVINGKVDKNVGEIMIDAIGFGGEYAFARYMKIPYEFKVHIGGDKYDFKLNGKRIDIKTSKCTSDSCLHISEGDLQKPMDYYVLVRQCYINSISAFRIIGFIRKTDFMKLMQEKQYFTKMYTVSAGRLSPPNILKDWYVYQA